MLDPSTWVLLSAIAFLAGFIDAIAGGGGLLTIPALLTFGLPPHLALGTNKLAATFGSATASFTYYRKKLFKPTFWVSAILATFIGAAIGTLVVYVLDAALLEKFLPLIIIVIAIYTLLHKGSANDNQQYPTKGRALTTKQWLQGLTLGFYDGFAGPGTGAFWTVSSMSLYKMNILISSGLARSMNFVSNFTSLVVFIALGQINWLLGLSMGVCIMLGAYIGAHSAIKFGAKFIRPVFITMVMILAAKLAWQAWF